MQEAVELTGAAVNKTIVSERRGRSRRGYGRLAALGLLVYALLVGIDRDEPLEKHLRRNRGVAKAPGFKRSIPDRTTIGRWKKLKSRGKRSKNVRASSRCWLRRNCWS